MDARVDEADLGTCADRYERDANRTRPRTVRQGESAAVRRAEQE